MFSFSILALLLLACSLLPAIAHEDDATNKEAVRIANTFRHQLNNEAIKVQVLPLFGGIYRVELSGSLDTKPDVTAATGKADEIKNAINKKAGKALIDKDGLVIDLQFAPPTDLRAKTVKQIVKLFNTYISDPRVKVDAQPRPKMKYEVVLSGALNKRDRDAVIQLVEDAKGEVETEIRPATIVFPGHFDALREDASDDIRSFFQSRLSGIHITVTQVKPNRSEFTVALSGALGSRKDIEFVRQTAAETTLEVNKRIDPAKVTSIDPNGLTLPDDMADDLWPLIALGGAGSADASLTKSAAAAVVDVINKAYGTDTQPVLNSDGNNFWIHAPRSKIQKSKAFWQWWIAPFLRSNSICGRCRSAANRVKSRSRWRGFRKTSQTPKRV